MLYDDIDIFDVGMGEEEFLLMQELESQEVNREMEYILRRSGLDYNNLSR